MLRRLLIAALLTTLAFTPPASVSIAATASDVSDQDIADAYCICSDAFSFSDRRTSISGTRGSNGMRLSIGPREAWHGRTQISTWLIRKPG